MDKRSIRSSLTIRESDVLRLAVQGHTDRVIASKLKVKLPTVRTYWQRIRIKTGGLNRSQAMVAYVREVGVGGEPVPQQIGVAEYFAALCASLPGTVCVTDLEGTIRFLNRAPVSQPPDVWIGANIRETIDPKSKGVLEKAMEVVRNTSAPCYYTSLVPLEDSVLQFATIAAPVFRSGRLEAMIFFAVESDGTTAGADLFGPFVARAIRDKG